MTTIDAEEFDKFRADTRETLDAILEQTKLTNGRVTRHDEELYGDPDRHKIGLVEIKEMVLDARAVLRGVKWAVPLLLGSNGAVALVVIFKATR